MTQPKFVIKPHLFGALFPEYLRRVVRYGIAGIITYFIIRFLTTQGLLDVYLPVLPWAIVLFVLVWSFFLIKRKLIKLHNTQYLFYDNRVVRQFKFFVIRRQSLPYSQISKVINDASIWNRISKTGNLVLRSSSSHAEDLSLDYVRHPEELDHKIHLLMKDAPHEEI